MAKPRVRTVEHVPGRGWVARCPFSGFDIFEPGFVWNSRSAARAVVAEARVLGRDLEWESRIRASLDLATDAEG